MLPDISQLSFFKTFRVLRALKTVSTVKGENAINLILYILSSDSILQSRMVIFVLNFLRRRIIEQHFGVSNIWLSMLSPECEILSLGEMSLPHAGESLMVV